MADIDSHNVPLSIYPILRFCGHLKSIVKAKFSPNGKYLGSVGLDGQLRIWDLNRLECIGIFLNFNNEIINDFTWDTLGETVILASNNGDALCISINQLSVNNTMFGWENNIHKALIGKVCHAETHMDFENTRKFKSVTSVASTNIIGQYFLTGGYDELIKKWDIRMFSLICDYRAHDGPIMSLEFSPDDSVIISSSIDGYVRLWDTCDLTILKTFNPLFSSPTCYACISPVSNHLLSISTTEKPRVWNLAYPDEYVNLDFFSNCPLDNSNDDCENLTDALINADDVSKVFKNSSLNGSTILEFLKAQGPCIFPAYSDTLLFIPYTFSNEINKYSNTRIGLGIWDIQSLRFKGYISRKMHRGSSLTSVSVYPKMTHNAIICTSGDFPDNSLVLWTVN